MKTLTTPLEGSALESFRAGEMVFLSGVVYTARDAAHQLMHEALSRGEEPPFDFTGAAVYYAGPCPARPDRVIGSAGPTTSGRMDAYSPLLIEKGLRVMIGKGKRSQEVLEAIRKYKGVYFSAIGGAGAYSAEKIISAEVVAYGHLQTEAVQKLCFKDFPLIVAADCMGGSIY